MTVKIAGQITFVPALHVPAFTAYLSRLKAIYTNQDGGVYEDSTGTRLVVVK